MHTHWSKLWLTLLERMRKRYKATHGAMRTRWSTLAHTVAEVAAVTVADAWGNVHPLVELWLTR